MARERSASTGGERDGGKGGLGYFRWPKSPFSNVSTDTFFSFDVHETTLTGGAGRSSRDDAFRGRSEFGVPASGMINSFRGQGVGI
jgi:hypothetical protein